MFLSIFICVLFCVGVNSELRFSIPDGSITSSGFKFRVEVSEDIALGAHLCLDINDGATFKHCNILEHYSMEYTVPSMVVEGEIVLTSKLLSSDGEVLDSSTVRVRTVSSTVYMQRLHESLIGASRTDDKSGTHRPSTAILVGPFDGEERDIALSLGSEDLYMIMPPGQLPLCLESWGHQITCCPAEHPLDACLPSVADYAILGSRAANPKDIPSEALIAVLDRVRGHVLFTGALIDDETDEVVIKLPRDARTDGGRCGSIDHALLPSVFQALPMRPCTWNADPELGATAASSRIPMKRDGPSFRSKMDLTARYGMHTAELSNVCLEDRGTFVLVHGQEEGMDEVVDSSSAAHMGKGYAGFAGFRGQAMVTGWSFKGMTAAAVAQKYDSIRWSQDSTTVLMSPVVPNNIFHAAQTFMPLVHAVYNSDVFPWVKDVGRVVVSSLHRAELPWSQGLLKVVLSILQGNLRQTRHSLPVHGAEDIDQMLAANPRSLLCFRHAVVVGAAELSSPFLGTQDESERFRRRLYRHLGLDSTKDQRLPLFYTRGAVMDDHPPAMATVTTTTGEGAESRDPQERASASSRPDPNTPVRVTVMVRGHGRGRNILNLDVVLNRLRATGVVDVAWMDTHILQLERLSFRSQVGLLKDTDVFVAAHGSGLQNLMFLNKHSAVIEIFTSPWYEPGYQPTALLMDIHYYVVPFTEGAAAMSSCDDLPPACLATPLIVQRRSLECLAIRRCNAAVDVDAMETAMWLASQAVRLTKRSLAHWRYGVQRADEVMCCQDGTSGLGLRDREDRQISAPCSEACFYEKGYKTLEA